MVQRYAIDFYRINDRGHQFTGDTARKEDYIAYGADVLAVMDGRIAAVRNDQAENDAPHASRRAVPIALETIGGNYVMLDIGRGRYVFYAHLKTGSVRFKVGDRVKRGDVIGLLGLSGNTPAPHLHLHLGDTAEPIGSEGLPYRIDDFEVVGECEAPAGMWGWPTACRSLAPNRRRNEIPLSWHLVRFPDRPAASRR
ncbi:MAG: M23 family metallopeptidase [Candidatus Saccharimonas sp.]|nr:M23 family metallopeptidase [Planctomycetaceae bacterium]